MSQKIKTSLGTIDVSGATNVSASLDTSRFTTFKVWVAGSYTLSLPIVQYSLDNVVWFTGQTFSAAEEGAKSVTDVPFVRVLSGTTLGVGSPECWVTGTV